MSDALTLEVFQDLYLRGPDEARSALRAAILGLVKPPWRHTPEKEEHLSKYASGSNDILVFERDASDGLVGTGLVLWSTPDGYQVTNIVPTESGSLSYASYNRILQDFEHRVAGPASELAKFKLELTPPRQSIDDWLPPSVADALRRFSSLANKQMGASHPLDRRRWLTFLIDAHRDNHSFNSERLARWLIEVERWPEDNAHDLAIEYEFALALLRQYDQAPAS